MSYKLTPRFHYTLSLFSYLKFKSKSSNDIFRGGFNTNTARTGLRLLLSSISEERLNIGVQAFTCHTVFQAIKKSGHSPVFLDINRDFQLCLVDLTKKVDNLDVLIVTHTFGFPEQMARIKELAQNVIIIEDCAHSFLSKCDGLYTGRLADASIFSTGLAKFPAIGTGGICLINDSNKFQFINKEQSKLKPVGLLSEFLILIKTMVLSILMKYPFYGSITYPLGKRLDSKLDLIDKFSFKENLRPMWVNRVLRSNQKEFMTQAKAQKDNANHMVSLLDSSVKIPTVYIGVEPNHYAFPVLIKDRDNLFSELLENNIESGKHFSQSLEWAQEYGYKLGDCPKTELIVKQVITLPIHKGVSSNVIKKMADIVNNYA